MDLAARIEALPNVAPLDGVPDAWFWTRTPAAPSYGSAVALTEDRKHALETYAHDSYDDGLARAVLAFAREHGSELVAPPETPLVVVEGFAHAGSAFDVVVAVSPTVHRYHQPEDPELHGATRAVFPAYRCEFSGSETEDEVGHRYSRAAGAQPSRWKREPNPYARMRYRTDSGREIPALGFINPKRLLTELTRLPERADGFVEFENWRRQVWTVTWQDDAYAVTDVGRLDQDGVLEFAKDALLEPNRAAGEAGLLK